MALPPPDRVFDYVYQVSLSGSTYTIFDSSPSTGIQAKAGGVTVVDDVANGGGDSNQLLGDVAGDKFDVTVEVLGNLPNKTFTFVGTVTGINGGGVNDTGFIASTGSGANIKYWYFTDHAYQGTIGAGQGDLTVNTSGTETICFMPGTMVATPSGAVAVEDLKVGDLVLTHDGRAMPVNWLGRQTVSTIFADKQRVLPIRFKAGALAAHVPSRDLLVSPDHALLVDGNLIQAGALVNGTSIVREHNVPTVFTYYHVEVDDHSLILAENTPAETFVDNIDRMGFDNWAEYEALYPEGKSITELPYPRAKAYRQVPVATRVKLAARAQEMGAADARSEVA